MTAWLKPVLLAASMEEIAAAIETTIVLLGFRYYIYRGLFRHLHPGLPEIRLDNCPPAWRAELAGVWDSPANPTRLRAFQEVTPIRWREIERSKGDLMSRARELGLVTGVTHPVHGPGGQRSALSFVKDRGGAEAEREIQVAMSKCHLMTAQVHESMSRVVSSRRPLGRARPARVESLSERECAILAWIAEGKTIAQIAGLLPISERTVNFHLANARRKLGATNSRHAVSKALSLRLIGPDSEPSPAGAG